jgi:hypothetical protein
MDTHEQRQAAYDLLVRGKYTQAEVNELGEKGHAFKNPDGHYSYPIDDVEDLRNAIHAVGRGNADHDALRKYIIGRAGALSATDQIPDNWNSDGSLKDAEAKAARSSTKECPTCSGSGKIKGGSTKCPDCGGTGEVASESKSRRNPAPGTRSSDEVRALRDEMRGVREERRVAISQFEIREVPNGAGGTNLKFEGYASITCADEDDDGHSYEMEDWLGPYKESVLRGAFSKTLSDKADVAFLVNHGGVTMARTKAGTLQLHEDLVGLHVGATLNPARGDVQILNAAVADGAVDEMSFAFRVMRQRWSYGDENGTGNDLRFLQELNLDKGDVSPVNYGANPHTGGLVSMRSAMGALLSGRGLTLEAWQDALQDLRTGKTISASTAATLQPIHDYLSQGVDQASSLAELLGLDASAEVDDDDTAGPDEEEGRYQEISELVLPDFSDRARADLMGMKR